jgi:hypothetical protein
MVFYGMPMYLNDTLKRISGFLILNYELPHSLCIIRNFLFNKKRFLNI